MQAADAHATIAVPYLVEVVAFLVSVVVIVPLFRRFGISPILGYLAIGAVIGPYGLALITDASQIRHFAELGVIFLLFTIGLELSFERLRAFSRLIFGLGTAQVLVSALVIGTIAYIWGNALQASIVIGLCLALSSTAMVMQLLHERNEIAAPHGRASFAILLFQDLAVVPILILVSAFGAEGGGSILSDVGQALLRALVAVAAILVLGRYVLRYLFRMVARTRSVDVFTAMILLAILATSLATGYAGLSLSLGACLAGLLLAETEFRHQIEGEIEPFKGLLLGLFFMGVGMSVDLGVITDMAGWVALSVLGLLVLKGLIVFALAMIFGLPRHDALFTAFLVFEAGEFAFVIIGQATLGYGLMPEATGQFMVIVAGVSMAFTPLLALTGAWAGRRLEPRDGGVKSRAEEMRDLTGHVVIAGYGRVGQAVAAVLRNQTIPYIALDLDTDRVRRQRQAGEPVYFGDAARAEVLKQAGVDRAATMLVTLDDPGAAGRTVEAARRLWPELHILVRARDTRHSDMLRTLGADAVVPETQEASLQLAGYVLRTLGTSEPVVNACIDSIRGQGYEEVCPVPDNPAAERQ